MEKKFWLNNEEVIVTSLKKKGQEVQVEVDGEKFLIQVGREYLTLDEISYSYKKNKDHIIIADREAFVSKASNKKSSSVPQGAMVAPMPCKVFQIHKKEGESVKVGETILVLEAMKMEHAIKASEGGVLKKLFYQVGDLVSQGAPLCEIE